MAILSKMSILAKKDPAYKACRIGVIGKELVAFGLCSSRFSIPCRRLPTISVSCIHRTIEKVKLVTWHKRDACNSKAIRPGWDFGPKT